MPSTFDPWLSAATAADVMAAGHASPDALAARQARRLTSLLAAAGERSRLYKRLIGSGDPAKLALSDLPIQQKAELMRHFDDWVTDPELRIDDLRRFTADRALISKPYLGRYIVWESSGSSGEPAVFVQDAAAMAVYDALEALRRPVLRPARQFFDPWSLGERIVFLGATSGHFASTVSIERLRRLNPAVGYSVHSISFLQPIDAVVNQLQALAPTVIATYPSAALLLAEERQAGRLNIAPGEIWTGGETLSAAMRSYVQDAFGCPVANSYGASEFLAIGSECNLGVMHLNSDWVILESVDAHGHAVSPGEFGTTTLLTNLANQVQPVIRYDLGDRVALHARPCKCGSHLPVIEVQGREDDTLRLGAPGTPIVSVLSLALSTVLEDEAGLFDFQLEQVGPCDLLLRTSLRGEPGAQAMQRALPVLASFLTTQGANDVHIEGHCGEPCRRGRSGKIKRVLATSD